MFSTSQAAAHRRLQLLTRDSEATITLRMTVRARQDLVHARVAMANQLRAHLQTTLPGGIGLFSDIDSAITLRFLTRFPSQDKAGWLSRARLGNWLRSVGYNQLANLDKLWEHLDQAIRGTTGPEAAARAQITLALVAVLTSLRTQIKALEDQIADQIAHHPDAAIFTSLPKSGTVRAARLIDEIGDEGHFCDPRSLWQRRSSGNVKVVTSVPTRTSTSHGDPGRRRRHRRQARQTFLDDPGSTPREYWPSIASTAGPRHVRATGRGHVSVLVETVRRVSSWALWSAQSLRLTAVSRKAAALAPRRMCSASRARERRPLSGR